MREEQDGDALKINRHCLMVQRLADMNVEACHDLPVWRVRLEPSKRKSWHYAKDVQQSGSGCRDAKSRSSPTTMSG